MKKRWMANKEMRFRKEKKGYVIYIPMFGAYWNNNTAMKILQLIQKQPGIEINRIADFLIKEYKNITKSELKKDLIETLTTFEEIGAIKGE